MAAILWGTVGIATQAIYRQSDLIAVAIGFYRLAFAFPVVAFLCWKVVGRQIFQINARQYWKMVLIGVMLALYQVFYFSAISHVGVAIATLVTLCTAPVLVSLVSVIVLKERLTVYTVIALVTALLGTVLLVGMPASTSVQGNAILGVGLALGSATGYAIVDGTSHSQYLSPPALYNGLLRNRSALPVPPGGHEPLCCVIHKSGLGLNSLCRHAADSRSLPAVFPGDAQYQSINGIDPHHA
jgi:drug/metabolite transporter (DMT)-like permease